MNPIDITAIVLTYNESQHIKRCLESLLPAFKAVVVVDSYSTDKTVEIAESIGARIYQNPWKNYADQFQWAIENTEIETEWVMRIDADEYLESQSLKAFDQLKYLPSDVNGIIIKRKYFFMGKWMKFGAMHPIFHLKIWRRGTGRIENKWMDERMILNKGSSVQLDIAIVDDNKNNLTWWTNKHNYYATREMIDSLNLIHHFLTDSQEPAIEGSIQSEVKRFVKDNIYSQLPLFVRPMLYFIYRYFFRFGFLDGKKGVIFHFLHAFWYRCLVDAKIYEAREWIGSEKDPEKIKKILSEKTSLKI